MYVSIYSYIGKIRGSSNVLILPYEDCIESNITNKNKIKSLINKCVNSK